MIAINDGNVTHLVTESTRIIDVAAQYGRALKWRRMSATDKPMSVEESRNARREAEYIQRRNGQKAALIQLFKVPETSI